MSDTTVASNVPEAYLAATFNEVPLPVVRVPMLDRENQLVAYELIIQGDGDDEANLMRRVLSTIVDGSVTRLARDNRVFIRLSRDLVMEQSELVLRYPRIGLVIDSAWTDDEAMMARLQMLSQRGCALLLDLADQPIPQVGGDRGANILLSFVRFVRIDASRLDAGTLRAHCEQLHARGLQVIAGHVETHATHELCLQLPFAAIQGGYLLTPEKVDVPVLTANRLSVLRLLRALEEESAGPVELGQVIRNDAILSYKLLGCVNSAYFALPKQLKSVEQAAIFFGLTRMRNWISTMALSGMNDRPPELLRAALIRAHMCEQLAQGMSRSEREMAFTAGLFSLLETLMCAPMDFLLEHVPLAPEIRAVLIDRRGPFAPLLEQVIQWEAGDLRNSGAQPQQIRRMAGIYLEATRWADHVYSFAEQRPS
ncbi:EAL and HDOD domain-containing protein [Dyella sp.]|uniref:EAL and HDOD domain-containing protein n=1 Tax=Dyella sp. TaxID=1869338 RepID=UPI002ED03C0E